MMKKAFYILFSMTMLSCGVCLDSVKLNNIKYFRAELLNDISTDEYYREIQLYYSNRNFEKIKDLSSESYRVLRFQKDGYVISSKSKITLKYEYGGVLYKKNNQVYIDLIEGTQDGCPTINRYKVKIVGDKLYLLEDNFLINFERVCYVYQKDR